MQSNLVAAESLGRPLRHGQMHYPLGSVDGQHYLLSTDDSILQLTPNGSTKPLKRADQVPSDIRFLLQKAGKWDAVSRRFDSSESSVVSTRVIRVGNAEVASRTSFFHKGSSWEAGIRFANGEAVLIGVCLLSEEKGPTRIPGDLEVLAQYRTMFPEFDPRLPHNELEHKELLGL